MPQRTCVGCREVLPKRAMIRIVRNPQGVQVDPTGKMAGRGAYLHDRRTSLEACGLEVVDIENLRRHYAPTLDEWATRFDERWEQIHALDPHKFDEAFRRKWRSYLWSCAEMFRSPRGQTHLFQIVFSNGNISRDNYPMSRAFLYA